MRQEGRPIRNTIPVNVIVDGRPVLIVGYGKVGRRKEKMLRESGATVEILAPEVNRVFRPGDCAGKLLVFACTDDKHVNQAVLADARAHRVPCCLSDMNWAEGDFVTPATVRTADAVVGVSTNGASCGSAKDIKNAIADFLARRAAAKLVVIGTSDRCLSSERRAAFHLPPERRAAMVRFLYEVKGVDELVVLDTCNRVEVAFYGCTDLETVKHLMQFHRLAPDEFYILENAAAFDHLVRVTAGLESAFAGEFHVVSQVKDAVAASEKAGMLHGTLKGIFDDVLRVAKDVRHAVEPFLDVPDVDRAAVAYAAARMPLVRKRTVVLGSGVLGGDIARHLANAGAEVSVLHHGDAVPACDVLFTACAAPQPFVTAAAVAAAGNPLVIDVGMPSNVCAEVSHVTLDELKAAARAKSGALDAALAAAARIIAAENFFTDNNQQGEKK